MANSTKRKTKAYSGEYVPEIKLSRSRSGSSCSESGSSSESESDDEQVCVPESVVMSKAAKGQQVSKKREVAVAPVVQPPKRHRRTKAQIREDAALASPNPIVLPSKTTELDTTPSTCGCHV